MAPFRFDRSWRFDVSLDRLWEAVADTSSYPRLWPWLDDFQAGPLAVGTTARFRVRPPLPYHLHFTVQVDDVIERERVSALVSGDVEGPARLELAAAGTGSEARLAWELDLRRPALTRAQPLIRPVMILGHNLVIAMGVRQFRRKAL